MRLVKRFIADQVRTAMSEARAVGVLGARQTGKSTLVRGIADEIGASVFDLDDDDTRSLVGADPSGFIADLTTPVVIDEVQRRPELLLAIKRRLDNDQSRGQFLITGSSDIRATARVSDALPGRVDYLTLMPFSQGELKGLRERFLTSAFDGTVPNISSAERGKHSYVETVCRGGYPEAQIRSSNASISRFFTSYLDSIFSRDVADVSRLRSTANLQKLLSLTATRTGSLMNYSALAPALAVDVKTVQHRLGVLETLKLINRLNPWSGSRTKRIVRAPKYYLNDSGLLATVIGIEPQQLLDGSSTAGQMFETFAINEVLRQISHQGPMLSVFFFRDHDGREVDLVLEQPDGETVAIEIKASASLGASDFRSLRFLRDRVGEKFKVGVIISTGSETVRYGDRLYAMPLIGLWA